MENKKETNEDSSSKDLDSQPQPNVEQNGSPKPATTTNVSPTDQEEEKKDFDVSPEHTTAQRSFTDKLSDNIREFLAKMRERRLSDSLSIDKNDQLSEALLIDGEQRNDEEQKSYRRN